MKWLQKLGKSLMLPVAVLPICGILMGLGYALCPAAMQGGDITGIIQKIGFFLVKAGGSLIDNMALLFAVGVAVGLADNHDGTASLAGLVSWLVITVLLSSGTVGTLFPGLLENEVNAVAFSKIQNAFIGILAGIIGSGCYNRFKEQTLPNFLAFFSGKRFVAIATALTSLIVAAVLLLVWPIIFSGLVMLGNGIVKLGFVGAGIYAFLNRLLIPFGLHHALNNVFWFDTIGLGDLTHFWAGDVTGMNGVTWDLGIYMSGFFAPCMFGIPGAALAIYRNAKPQHKKTVSALMISAALCAFICGVTEPFEFSFMFAAFPLYVIYALLYCLFTILACVLGFRAGFSFSAGFTDLVFSASLPAAKNTLLIIPMGILAFVVYYLVFNFAIKKFNYMTPGREEDEEDGDALAEKAPASKGNYAEIAQKIYEAAGKDNIESVDYCVTRLRLSVKDASLVDEKACKAAGALGVMKLSKNSVQIVIGTTVEFVANELAKLV